MHGDFEDIKYKVRAGNDRSEWTSVKETLDLDFPNLPYLIDRQANVKLSQVAERQQRKKEEEKEKKKKKKKKRKRKKKKK